jgi:hypothetical protein
MRKLFYLAIGMVMLGISQSSAQGSCNAQYTWSPYQSTSSNALGVNFNNTSTGAGGAIGNTTQSHLYFGDGSSNIIGGYGFHNYSTPGTYNTFLVVQTVDSFSSNIICSDTAYQTVTINYLPCAVAISAIDNTDGTATFTANALGGTTGMTYNWSFGDGTTGTGSPVNHTYATAGYHWILLTSTGAGCTGSDSMYFHNNDTSAIDCNALSADFTYTVANLDVTFTPTATPVNGGTTHVWWSFGDGVGQASGANAVVHTYNAAANFSATMITSWVDSLTGQLYCVDSVTHTVTIDSSTFTNLISGSISWGAPVTGTDSIEVWLITYDSVANTLTAVDSTYLPFPNVIDYTFNNPPAGDYLVKAALLNQTPGTAGLLPTYYQSSAYWSTATTIHHNGAFNPGKNIYMLNGTVTSGPGFVGGNISSGAGKGTGTGVAGMLVYLRNSSNALVSSAVTDINGDYSFSNIPVGTYNVYPELINYATTPYNAISVTTAQAHVEAIDFEKVGNTIVPKNKPTSIASISKNDGLNVYPNPVKNQLLIESKNGLFNKVAIVNTLGQTIQQNKLVNGINKIQLSGINSGIYYLLISGADQTRSMKIIKE